MKIRSNTSFDEISLGEIMLRLDPADRRIRTTRTFDVWEGGGEYNVARGLHKCFGLKTAVITSLVENEVGRLIEDLIDQGGVNTDFIVWKEFDGVGRNFRNGLNFTERGFGVRGALGVSDRGNTAISKLEPSEVDWEEIFGVRGSKWFHTGGIFAGLSDTACQVANTAIDIARKNGTVISYDLNYRPSLWSSQGGKSKAQSVNREIANKVDVLFGNEEDFEVALGLEISGADEKYSNLDMNSYKKMIEQAVELFPNLQVVAVTLRTVKTASINDWTALAWSKSEGFELGSKFENLEIYDRVGGGDSFASGLIYGLLNQLSLKESLQLGIAHGALAMTTPGDTSMVTLNEVQKLAAGGNARVQR